MSWIRTVLSIGEDSWHSRPYVSPPVPVPELLSPAGNWDCARAAVAGGADAIITIRAYQDLLADRCSPDGLLHRIKATEQLGVTEGTLA